MGGLLLAFGVGIGPCASSLPPIAIHPINQSIHFVCSRPCPRSPYTPSTNQLAPCLPIAGDATERFAVQHPWGGAVICLVSLAMVLIYPKPDKASIK